MESTVVRCSPANLVPAAMRRVATTTLSAACRRTATASLVRTSDRSGSFALAGQGATYLLFSRLPDELRDRARRLRQGTAGYELSHPLRRRAFSMLKGIDPLLGPELLAILRAMGHGDEIVVADANFPSAHLAQKLVRADGIDALRMLGAILSVMPLDDFASAVFRMAV